MSLNEISRDIETIDLLDCFKRSQKLLARNGKNRLIIESHQNFPQTIHIQPLSIKRIVNNLLSNALKHTNNGSVSL